MSFTSTHTALPVPVWPPRYANRYVRISRWIITIHYPVLMSGLILRVHNPILASFPCRCERWIVGKYNLHRQNTIAWNLLAALTSRILSADWDGRVKRIISPDLNYPDCRILESCNTTRGFFSPPTAPVSSGYPRIILCHLMVLPSFVRSRFSFEVTECFRQSRVANYSANRL